MIKVPATPEGIPAIRALIGEGINVNVTLLFSQEVYAEVAGAYLAGLEDLVSAGGDPGGVASVASFFVSRIDAAADARIVARARQTMDPAGKSRLEGLTGKIAIANAKLAYRRYQALFSGERWQALAVTGARTQRLLWASTGTKDPHYRDVLYVEELIGPDTVNTMPPATLDAFRDHGRLRESLTEDIESAAGILDGLAEVGISLVEITDKLLADGVRLFAEAFERLLEAVETRTGNQGRGNQARVER